MVEKGKKIKNYYKYSKNYFLINFFFIIMD